jgi:hypothetical protein
VDGKSQSEPLSKKFSERALRYQVEAVISSGAAAFRVLKSLPLYLLAPLKEWIARSPSSIMFLPLRGESTLSTAVKPTAWLHPEF